MFQLTGQSIIQFTSLIVFVILLSLVFYSKQVRLKRLFATFLIAGMGISITGLLMNLRLPYEQMMFWKMALPLFTTWAIVAYAHFITGYANKETNKVVKWGYSWLCISFVLVSFGYITQGLNVFNNETISVYYSSILNSLIIINDIIMVLTFFLIVKVLKFAEEPEERNRTTYLLAGLSFMIVANGFKYFIQDYYYVLACIGYTGNAIVITYTMLKYRLLDIQVVMKKWIVYTGVTICVTLAYLALLLGLSNLLRLLPPQLGIPATIVMVVMFGYIFNWVKSALDKAADKLFYGSRYVHRQMLINFASKMSNLINMKEIANALIIPLAKTVRAKQVSLLLPCNGRYTSKFIARLNDKEEILPIMLHQKSVLTEWLEEKGVPLSVDTIDNDPELEDIYQEDKEGLENAHIKILCPIISKRRLVGIMALSKKEAQGHYSKEESDLIIMLARESAVAIENAQIYTSAKEKANTDELTGLYNHRYLQESLNREIEECAVSGDDFSLLFIDLDFFKTYNDIYGHVLGDEILKDVGQIIQSSIRDTDIGGRYGGDEFAAILKGTSTEGARIVAERIRSKLESTMNEKGFLITCSIGVASWRVDGVVRGTIIQAADSAVYAAKLAGRNRVCLASEVDTIEVIHPSTSENLDNNVAVESIVFALASTVDARDHYTYGHSKAVSKYATELATAVGYSKEEIRRIRSAGLLHDIGKLNLPDSILTKRGPLTDDEWEKIKNHPELALSILKYVVGLRDCIDAVLYHHERWDGSGYPRGLKEKDIPLDARIMAIADAYDAMISERVYKEGKLTEEEAIEELERCAGTQFDPELIEVFVKIRQDALLLASYGA
jgi:diguanylate cyclase (GGDEF)-like protein/putative nucleotidyltransferase with HDIG domain